MSVAPPASAVTPPGRGPRAFAVRAPGPSPLGASVAARGAVAGAVVALVWAAIALGLR